MRKQYLSYVLGIVTLVLFGGVMYGLFVPGESVQTGQANRATPTSSVSLDEVEALEERSEPNSTVERAKEPTADDLRPTRDPALADLPPTPLPLPKEPTATPYPIQTPTPPAITFYPTDELQRPVPPPTATSLPEIDPSKAGRFSVQNLVFEPFEPAVPLAEEKLFIEQPTWSHDGQWLTYIRDTPNIIKFEVIISLDGKTAPATTIESEIVIARPDGSEQRVLTIGAKPLWSPDGKLLAFMRMIGEQYDPALYILDVATGKETYVTVFPHNRQLPLSDVVWLSNTTLLYYQDGLLRYDYETQTQTDLLPLVSPPLKMDDERPFLKMTSRPDLNLLVISNYLQQIFVFRYDTERLTLLREVEDSLETMSISPDGRFFAYSPSSILPQVKIVSIEDDSFNVQLPEFDGHIPHIAWGPDSQSLLYTNYFGIFGTNLDGSGHRQLVDAPVQDFAWQPTGEVIFYITAEEQTRLLRVVNKGN